MAGGGGGRWGPSRGSVPVLSRPGFSEPRRLSWTGAEMRLPHGALDGPDTSGSRLVWPTLRHPLGLPLRDSRGETGAQVTLGWVRKGAKRSPPQTQEASQGPPHPPEITCLAIIPHPEASALLRAGAQRSPVTLSCSLAEGQAPRPLPCVGPETPRVPSVLMPPCSHPLLPQPRPGQSHDSCSRTFPRGPQLPPAPCIQAACGPSLELQPLLGLLRCWCCPPNNPLGGL